MAMTSSEVKHTLSGFNFAIGYCGVSAVKAADGLKQLQVILSSTVVEPDLPKKNKGNIPGGKRAARDRSMFKQIWPYVVHAFYQCEHAFTKGASKETQLQWTLKAMTQPRKHPAQGKTYLKPANFTAKDLRRTLEYYAKKGALTQVGSSQFFRKGW